MILHVVDANQFLPVTSNVLIPVNIWSYIIIQAIEVYVYTHIFMASYLLINVGTNYETDGHVD